MKEKQWWNKPDHELIKDRIDHLKEVYDRSKIDVDEEERPSLYEDIRERDERVLNLLDMIVKKKKGLKRDGKYLLVPVYDTKRGEKIASVMGLKTTRRIRLDEYGWTVWENIDGGRNVRDIGNGLKERFGEEVEPLYPRLSKFLAYLVHLDLIRLEQGKKEEDPS